MGGLLQAAAGAAPRLRTGFWPVLAAGMVAAGAYVLTLALSGREQPSPADIGLAAEAPVVDDWRRLMKPMAHFGLEAPELSQELRVYEARRKNSGERLDILAFNGFEDDKPYLMLRFHRRAAESSAPAGLFVQTVRVAGEDALVVERMTAPRDMASKFGPVETAEATIVSGERTRTCTTLRIHIAEGALELSGLACGRTKPMDRSQLSCLIDRVALLAGGDDRAVRQAFSAAEGNRRKDCNAQRIVGGPRRLG